MVFACACWFSAQLLSLFKQLTETKGTMIVEFVPSLPDLNSNHLMIQIHPVSQSVTGPGTYWPAHVNKTHVNELCCVQIASCVCLSKLQLKLQVYCSDCLNRCPKLNWHKNPELYFIRNKRQTKENNVLFRKLCWQTEWHCSAVTALSCRMSDAQQVYKHRR